MSDSSSSEHLLSPLYANLHKHFLSKKAHPTPPHQFTTLINTQDLLAIDSLRIGEHLSRINTRLNRRQLRIMIKPIRIMRLIGSQSRIRVVDIHPKLRRGHYNFTSSALLPKSKIRCGGSYLHRSKKPPSH